MVMATAAMVMATAAMVMATPLITMTIMITETADTAGWPSKNGTNRTLIASSSIERNGFVTESLAKAEGRIVIQQGDSELIPAFQFINNGAIGPIAAIAGISQFSESIPHLLEHGDAAIQILDVFKRQAFHFGA